MSKNPIFSIVTVTCDNLAGLQKTHNSLKIQNLTDFEWIVIDGASKDSTAYYLSTTKALWVSEPDNGIYDAMNKGLMRSNGDYVLFLNAGDCITGANTLAQLANFIAAQKTTPDFIYGDSFENNIYKPAREPKQIAFGMFTHHQSMLYHRSIISSIHYNTRYKIAADYDFTLRALGNSNSTLYFPFPICLFEQGGVSQTNAFKGRSEQFFIRKRLKTSNLIKNIFIFLLQSAAWTLRSIAPGFYWRVKSSGNKRPGLAQT